MIIRGAHSEEPLAHVTIDKTHIRDMESLYIDKCRKLVKL